MLHFAGPPGVGGVETTIAYHARGLADLGYKVRLISGSGQDFDPRIETFIDPRFGSRHPDVLAAKSLLDRGVIPTNFAAQRDALTDALANALRGCGILIAHNVHTLNKNLVLTAALAQLQHPARVLAWCHDLAWTNPQYQPELHPGYPWDLLRQPWQKTHYITVSEPRQHELAALLGVPDDAVRVIVPGVDMRRFLRWTVEGTAIIERLKLLEADGILLLPARITRRKNIELGLHVLRALRQHTQADYRLIVTGPPGPHNPANPGYLGELLRLRHTFGMDAFAHFLYELGDSSSPFVPSDAVMADLYQVTDALFFPSTQEGFGIPMLEAALTRLPIFCSDIPPFRTIAQGWAHYFDPNNDSAEKIAQQIIDALTISSAFQLRRNLRHHYRWEAIIRDKLVPMIEDQGEQTTQQQNTTEYE